MAVPGGTLPFREFVLKVHSRCDLACDHCYVYEHADQSWRSRPTFISPETVAKAAERIADHARDHHLTDVRVILHGGEPLLVGVSRLAGITQALRAVIEPICRLDLRIHTNGVRLNEEYCELFVAERVKVGISLDGDRAANDRHRRYADGRSSYDRVLRAVGLLRQDRYRGIYAGLLATIDIRNDPVAAYRALAALEPPNLDFLLPHGTWDTPPPEAGVLGVTRYGDWLGAVFDEWTRDGRRTPIRMFKSIIATSHGGVSSTESLGLAPSELAVIETDGTIEQADSIKVAYDGAPATGLDIFRNRLDDAADHPAIKARQLGLAGLSATCQHCPVVTSCGGGLYAHRYRSGSFKNPSVYCGDLKKIITHVQANEAARHRPGQSDLVYFDALAAGYGDAESIAYLRSDQRKERRKLLRLIRVEASGRADDTFTAGWALLVSLDGSAPAAVEGVLEHPYVRAWAERCLRAFSLGEAADLGYLASIAAAAAIRCGASAEVDVPVSAGHVYLPTLGRLRVGDVGRATVTVTGDAGFRVRAASRDWRVEPGAEAGGDDWETTRELRVGDFVVRLEDTDPYRDVHEYPPAARLTNAEAAAWQAQFATAWSLIEDVYPAYAPGLIEGLRSLMPLANDVPGRDISATASEAYGAVAAARPATGEDLALLIIHEFQHVKLGALIDMFDLFDPTDRRLFYAPWREDPRPISALLQGTYAHLSVADYWRSYRHLATGSAALEAAERFARWRTLTAEAIDTLTASGALTSLGTRFVEGMRATIEPWLDESVPQSAAEAAQQWTAGRRAEWNARRDARPADAEPGPPD
jgi:uncharacterized protein